MEALLHHRIKRQVEPRQKLDYRQMFWVAISEFQLFSQSWNSGISKLQFWDNTTKFWLMHSSYYYYIIILFWFFQWRKQSSTVFGFHNFSDSSIYYSFLLLWPFTFTSWSESSSTPEGRRTGTHARMLQSLPPLYTSYIQHKQQGQ